MLSKFLISELRLLSGRSLCMSRLISTRLPQGLAHVPQFNSQLAGYSYFRTFSTKDGPKQEQQASQKSSKPDDMDFDEDEENIDYDSLRTKPSVLSRTGTILFFASVLAYILSYVAYKKKVPDYGNPALKKMYEVAAKSDEFYMAIWNIFTKPMNRKMLPDMPKGIITPKTFVLNLNGTLIHSGYKLGVGYEIVKRPGLDMFLQRLSRMGEVVVFADDDLMYLSDVYEHLDPRRSIFSNLFGRESMVATKNGLVKDLSYLNRDLSNVVVIDWDEKRLARQPDNLILLSQYKAEGDDRELFSLLPFLEHLASPGVVDVRKEISKYGKADGYNKYMQELMDNKLKLVDQRKAGIGGIFEGIENIGKTSQPGKK